MMNNDINYVAKLIVYKGPDMSEIVNEAIDNGWEVDFNKLSNGTQIDITSYLPYMVHVNDRYIYDLDGYLVKHITIINGKENIIFDKYYEIKNKISRAKKVA
jgi:hypothetical protein